MPTSFTCSCGKKLQVKLEHVGRRAQCPSCGKVFVVPPASASDFDVFISYSQADRETAEAIRVALESTGVRCWIAPRNILPGKQWGAAIIEGITQCRVMVLVFSGHSNQSSQVIREVERAVSKSLIIIPFRIADQPMSKAMEYYLSSPHWLDALSEPLAPHLELLTHTVQALLGDRGSNVEQTPAARAVFDGRTGSEFRPQAARPHTLARSKHRPAMIVAAIVGVAAASIVGVSLWINRTDSGAHAPEPMVPLATAMSELPIAENLLVVTPVIYDPNSGTSSAPKSSLLKAPPPESSGPTADLTPESRVHLSANPNTARNPSRRPPQSLAGVLNVDAVVSTYMDVLFIDLRFVNQSDVPQLISAVHVLTKNAATHEIIKENAFAERLHISNQYDVDVSDLRSGARLTKPVSQLVPPKGTDRFVVRIHGKPKERSDDTLMIGDRRPSGKVYYVLEMTFDVEVVTTVGTILLKDLTASFAPDADTIVQIDDPYYQELIGFTGDRRGAAK